MNVPNHIAIILDGNGRWAKAKGLPRGYGHVKGCANLEQVCYDIKDLGVKYLTVYAFSTENWKRSREEVDGLMKLFRSYLKKCIKTGCGGWKSFSGSDHRGYDWKLPGYCRSAGSGSSDTHQRRTETFQFPYVAAGLYGILFYRRGMAGFP